MQLRLYGSEKLVSCSALCRSFLNLLLRPVPWGEPQYQGPQESILCSSGLLLESSVSPYFFWWPFQLDCRQKFQNVPVPVRSRSRGLATAGRLSYCQNRIPSCNSRPFGGEKAWGICYPRRSGYQAFSTLVATTLQNQSSCLGAHPSAKPVRLRTLPVVRSECGLHKILNSCLIPSEYLSVTRDFRVQNANPSYSISIF